MKSAAELIRVKDKFQLTIPVGIRKHLRIAEGGLMEVSVQDNAIVLRPQTVTTAKHDASLWLQDYYAQLPESPAAQALSDEAVVDLVKALR